MRAADMLDATGLCQGSSLAPLVVPAGVVASPELWPLTEPASLLLLFISRTSPPHSTQTSSEEGLPSTGA